MPNTVVKLSEAEGTCLETGWEENLRRNAARADAVPERAVEAMLGKLVPPQRWEARGVDWVCV